jgi:hypothetical protein
VMESCHTFFVEKLMIGLSHFWHAHVVRGMDTTHCKLVVH